MGFEGHLVRIRTVLRRSTNNVSYTGKQYYLPMTSQSRGSITSKFQVAL